MRYSALVFAAGSASAATTVTGTIAQPPGASQVNAPAGSLALGDVCGAAEQCGPGVDCFSSTSNTFRTCGGYYARCTEDSQCAYNTCKNGSCGGYLESSLYLAHMHSSTSTAPASSTASTTATASTVSTTATVSIVTGTIVQPTGAPQITAPAGSLPLGEACGADEQCGPGVTCWGSTAGTIRTCGNFNAPCTDDSQCAFNTCNNRLCNGFLPSSAYPANSVSSTTAAPVPSTPVAAGNATTVAPTGTMAPTPLSPSSTVMPFTGGASVGGALSGFVAVAAGLVAYAL